MPKITDYTLATELTEDTVLMGVQNGDNKRIPASLLEGVSEWRAEVFDLNDITVTENYQAWLDIETPENCKCVILAARGYSGVEQPLRPIVYTRSENSVYLDNPTNFIRVIGIDTNGTKISIVIEFDYEDLEYVDIFDLDVLYLISKE